jgi:hypothetical protein
MFSRPLKRVSSAQPVPADLAKASEALIHDAHVHGVHGHTVHAF